MSSLNTDCLIEIIKFLNLKDQISLYQVSDILQSAVTTFWRMKFKHIHINLLLVSITDKEFEIFLEAVHDIVQILNLRFLKKQKYEVFKKFVFERVTDFRFHIINPCFLVDSDLRDMRKSLPNLNAFSPHGNFTGLYMEEWPLLKDLNLSYCCKLAMLPLETILSRLKLEKLIVNIYPKKRFEQMNLVEAEVQNLKYLEVNAYGLQYFLTKPLTALKELVISTFDSPKEIFKVLVTNWQTKDIRLVETANVKNTLKNCVETRLNVEQLTIVNDRRPLPSVIIPSLSLLTDLRKLRFVYCCIELKNFISLLKNANQLLEISFVLCKFDVDNIKLHVDEILANRKTKLKLNFYENRLIDDSDRPTWCKEMEEPIYVSVNAIGNRAGDLLELTDYAGEALHFEHFYIAFR